LHVCGKWLEGWIAGIAQHGKASRTRQQFMEKFEPFWPKLSAHRRDTGEIAAWSGEAGDEPKFDWIRAGAEHDRNGRGRRLGGKRSRWSAGCSDDRHSMLDQIGDQLGQSRIIIIRPAIFDHQVAAFDIAGLSEPIAEGRHDIGIRLRCS
jgi:hypothetical protein